MQFPHTPQQTQLPLFEAFLAQPMAPTLKEVVERPWTAEPEVFSELSLRGAAGNCLNLLAPILRELSEDQDARWLTLIAPPASLTQTWLRDAGLNRERICCCNRAALKALNNWRARHYAWAAATRW
jgi:cell division inhibitor SulA